MFPHASHISARPSDGNGRRGGPYPIVLLLSWQDADKRWHPQTIHEARALSSDVRRLGHT
jgi:hypothetical protein